VDVGGGGGARRSRGGLILLEAWGQVRPCSKASISDRNGGVGIGVGLFGSAWPNH
jgi:hypothetical protein